MISIFNTNQIPKDISGTAVTIGKFDAVHLGHQQLIREVVGSAQEQMLVPVVLTFDRHPASTLNDLEVPVPVIGEKQKERLIADLGVELMLSLPFDEDFARLSADDFVSKVLVKELNAKVVVVGEGFRFGDKAQGNVELLKRLGDQFGFEVKVMPHLIFEGKRISTSWIRELLLQGNVETVAKLLGRYHCTEGLVVHGLKIGREIGFPTANMSRDAEGLLPRDAVYAGWLYAEGKTYMTALSVGTNETFTAVPRLLEAHILDIVGLDLYDKVIVCEYVKFIRPAAKFNGVEDLVDEINRDLEKIRLALG